MVKKNISLNWLVLMLTSVLSFFSQNVYANCRNLPDIYVVVRSQDFNNLDSILQSRCISGVTLYYSWREVEPSEGIFDVAKMNFSINRIKMSNKKINLAILPGRWTPNWFMSQQVKLMYWSHTDTNVDDTLNKKYQAPVPWDDRYIRQFSASIKSIVKSIKIDNYINSISITGPSNTNGIELAIIGADADLESVEFSYEKLTAAWMIMIDEFSEVSSSINYTIALHTRYGSKDTDGVSILISAYANKKLKSKFIPMLLGYEGKSWFNDKNKYSGLILNNSNQADGALQAIKIYSKFDDYQGFVEMYDKSVLLNPLWLEIWADDVINGYHLKYLEEK